MNIIGALFLFAFVVYFVPLSSGIFKLSSQIPFQAYFYLAFHPREVLLLYEKKDEFKNNLREKEHLVSSLVEENTALKSALEYKKNAKKKLIVAKVVGYATDPLLKTIIIDRGNEAGIKEGMPVINEFGLLLGRVDRVFEERSFIKQIQSPDIDFLVHFEGGGIKSDFVARGMINYVLGTKIQKGEYGDRIPVVTSGLDGKFPPGLLVGEARMFTLSKDKTFIEAIIETVHGARGQVFIVTETTY